jgi:hypothetical protein
MLETYRFTTNNFHSLDAWTLNGSRHGTKIEICEILITNNEIRERSSLDSHVAVAYGNTFTYSRPKLN